MSLKVTTEPRENRQLAVSIEVPQERVDQELRKAAQKVASQYRLPGFRKGKAPYHIVVQQFGLANLYSEFVDDLGQEVFRTAVEQEGIEPYAMAALEDVQFEPLTYKLVVPLEPKIELGDYRSVRVEEEAHEVDEEAISQRLEQLREQYSSWQAVERPSQFGDMMTIDVKSVIPAEAEGDEPTVVLDETDWDVTPDEENPMDPPGFDAALLGLKPGETKEFTLSWPAESQSIHAGKEAHFTVSVKKIEAYEKPALDDDFAKQVGPDFETMDDLRKNIRETLEEGHKEQAENAFVEKALDAVTEISTLDYPPAVVEDQMDSMMQEFERRLRMFGIENLDRYFEQVGQDKNEYRESLRDEATKVARRNLVLSELLRTEGLTVDDSEIDARIGEMVKSPEEGSNEQEQAQNEAMANLLRSPTGQEIIRNQILHSKTVERLLAIVRGEEVPEPGAPSAPAGEIEEAAEESAVPVAGDEAPAENPAQD